LKTEVRYLAAPEFRVESRDGEPTRITGYAAIYGSLSEDLGGFREKLNPGTFTRSLREQTDIRALVEHNDLLLIGRTSAGTLKVTEDERGLAVEITPPNTSVGRDLIENIRVGNLDKMSFRFNTRSDKWLKTDDGTIRELSDVDLIEVSVVSTPAYKDTSIAIRSLQTWSKSNDFDPATLKTLEYKLKLACL
jgi:HK97 family phage prohead protease